MKGGGAGTTEADRRHMAAALALSKRNLGRTWPNPSVGCVLTREGRVVGRGATAWGGRPHAETEALARAGPAARGATAYVTLEPCAHRGETPPCCDALIEAGVARVVTPMPDPDPRVSGSGLHRLAEAGVEVTTGPLRDEAEFVHAGFLSRVRRGRPLVTAKAAASLDGRVATAGGRSKWITGADARRAGHALRASHDAVMVGRATVVADNPSLTCRLPGMAARSPLRVVVDSALELPRDAAVVRTARRVPTWVVCAEGVGRERVCELESLGVEVLETRRATRGAVDPGAMLDALGGRGLTRILVEGGPRLVTSLLEERLVDRLAWFTAPRLIGGDGLAAVGNLALDLVDDASPWRVVGCADVGADRLTLLEAAGRG